MEKTVKGRHVTANKYIYAVLLCSGLLLLLLNDFSGALICSGISLAFDPFNQRVNFNNRPLWQKAWLILHLTGVFVLLWMSIK